jgi:hypothetical protein
VTVFDLELDAQRAFATLKAGGVQSPGYAIRILFFLAVFDGRTPIPWKLPIGIDGITELQLLPHAATFVGVIAYI